MSEDQKAFWVQWRGFIRDQDGNKVDPDALKNFLSVLTTEFAAGDVLLHPAAASQDGVLHLTSSLNAASAEAAIHKARHAFNEGFKSTGRCLSNGGRQPWNVYVLETTTVEARELTAA
jgi:hypothetical protein